MTKLLTIAAIAAASTALAVESSNTFGILRVDSTAAQTIVSVPWVAAGGGNINVADIVKTANLNNGDKLYYYNTGTTNYRVWELTNGAWQEAVPAGESATQNPVLARGNAIILERFAPQDGSIANCFYLYGQYTTDASSTTCVANGYTLLAPSTTEDFNLNATGVMSGTPNANDRIGVPVTNDGIQSLALLRYNDTDNKWGIKKATWDYSLATIPAGQGVWYISAGGEPTFTWTTAAQ